MGHITIPYIAGITESLSRRISKTGVKVHTKPVNTIRSILVALKDKVEKLGKSGTIYNIRCED